MVILNLLFVVAAQAGQAHAVSADDALAAIAGGAYVVDVRAQAQFDAGHLPQSSAMPAKAAELPLQELAGLLARAGVDSSRTMLVVGDAGDANAQALWQRLTQVTAGRVLWLVGGVQEWQMRGHSLTTTVSQRPPVPQFLVPFNQANVAPANASRMAGSRVRTSAMLERNFTSLFALN